MRRISLLLLLLVPTALGAQSLRAPKADVERPEHSDRDDDSWLPYRSYSPRSSTPRTSPARTSRPPASPSASKESPWTPAAVEARDPDLARCDRYKAQLEVLLREEMRGRNTGEQQRTLHERRLRDGC